MKDFGVDGLVLIVRVSRGIRISRKGVFDFALANLKLCEVSKKVCAILRILDQKIMSSSAKHCLFGSTKKIKDKAKKTKIEAT